MEPAGGTSEKCFPLGMFDSFGTSSCHKGLPGESSRGTKTTVLIGATMRVFEYVFFGIGST